MLDVNQKAYIIGKAQQDCATKYANLNYGEELVHYAALANRAGHGASIPEAEKIIINTAMPHYTHYTGAEQMHGNPAHQALLGAKKPSSWLPVGILGAEAALGLGAVGLAGHAGYQKLFPKQQTVASATGMVERGLSALRNLHPAAKLGLGIGLPGAIAAAAIAQNSGNGN